jgi:hypothetical protein
MAVILGVATILFACLATVATLRFLTGCVSPGCKKRMRVAYGAAALASFAGVFVLVAAGLFGVGTLLFK